MTRNSIPDSEATPVLDLNTKRGYRPDIRGPEVLTPSSDHFMATSGGASNHHLFAKR